MVPDVTHTFSVLHRNVAKTNPLSRSVQGKVSVGKKSAKVSYRPCFLTFHAAKRRIQYSSLTLSAIKVFITAFLL